MTAGAPVVLMAVLCAVSPPQPASARQAGPPVPPVSAGQTPAGEHIAEIRVHGNHVTGDEELVALAGIAVGDPFDAATLETVANRLRRTGRFDDVQVLKRYASIADPSRVALVIIVNEGPVRLVMPDEDDPDGEIRAERRGWLGNLMWLPVLHVEDGYGVTYGARLAYAGLGGERSRMSFPLTWGGRRRAGVELDRTFTRGPISRAQLGLDIRQERNPAYEIDDRRQGLRGRLESAAGPLRAGLSLGLQAVNFGGLHDDIQSVGTDVAFDTRLNPLMPRNAVYARASWERLDVLKSGVLHQVRLDAQGFVGLWGQTVLALRARREDFNKPAPPYLRSLLGGWASLRGFKAGTFTGDTMVTGSAELLLPVSSPLSAGQLGVSIFADTGAAYDKGERLTDQPWKAGYGGSVWITFTAFRMSLAVAHGKGASTRVHVGGGFVF
jgi:outer membrane protein assembly factor BamA